MRVLVVAPHPDDEIIGVGGTIAKRVKSGDEVYVCVVTKGIEPLFEKDFVGQVVRGKGNIFFGFSSSDVRNCSKT